MGGIGTPLLEHTVDHRAGRIVNANLADYLVPVTADVPDVKAIHPDGEDREADQLGVKGLGLVVPKPAPGAPALPGSPPRVLPRQARRRPARFAPHGERLMLNIAEILHRWCGEGRPFAVATVVDVHGSAPLPVGTSVAVDEDGNAVCSLSGGCVEGAAYELCRQVLHDRGAVQRAWCGYSDEDAFAVGLRCGGELDVVVQHIDPATQPHLGRPSRRR